MTLHSSLDKSFGHWGLHCDGEEAGGCHLIQPITEGDTRSGFDMTEHLRQRVHFYDREHAMSDYAPPERAERADALMETPASCTSETRRRIVSVEGDLCTRHFDAFAKRVLGLENEAGVE
jgi:hypothetical protein